MLGRYSYSRPPAKFTYNGGRFCADAGGMMLFTLTSEITGVTRRVGRFSYRKTRCVGRFSKMALISHKVDLARAR